MATSGSVDFNVTRDEIIQSALEDLGIMAAGDTTSSSSFTDHSAGAAVKLNALVKQFGFPTDGSPGMQLWARKRAYLFLQTGQAVYTLGPTTTATGATNKWASSYVSTTIGANEAAGQTTLTMTDGSVFSNGDRIGIELNSGAMQWTTVNGAPAGNDVTISAALTGAADAGKRVFGYTTTNQGRRPLEIITAVMRDTDGNDSPLYPMDAQEYEYGVPAKGQDTMPIPYYYENTLTDGTIYFDAEPTDVTQVVRVVYRSPFEDFDASSDNPDFDPIWIRPLIYGLELELIPRFGKWDMMNGVKALRDEALAIARNATPEKSLVSFTYDSDY